MSFFGLSGYGSSSAALGRSPKTLECSVFLFPQALLSHLCWEETGGLLRLSQGPPPRSVPTYSQAMLPDAQLGNITFHSHTWGHMSISGRTELPWSIHTGLPDHPGAGSYTHTGQGQHSPTRLQMHPLHKHQLAVA